MIRLIRDWQADVVKTTSPIFEPYEYDTTTVTLLQLKGGRIGKVASVIDCLQPYYFHVHLVGSEGSLLDHRFSSRRLKGTRRKMAGTGLPCRWSIPETSRTIRTSRSSRRSRTASHETK